MDEFKNNGFTYNFYLKPNNGDIKIKLNYNYYYYLKHFI